MGKAKSRHQLHYALAALGLLLALTACTDRQAAAQVQLQFTVTTIQDVSDAPFSTWLSLLATSLLPANTPGAFLGTVPTDVVETTCQAVEAGQLSFEAQVTVQGDTESHQIQIQNIGGCDASSSSPEGVELVYTDETGATTAVICDQNALDIGCQIYVTGDDVTQYYNGAIANGTSKVNDQGGRRKLLGAVCFIAGGATGATIATFGSVDACAGLGPLYLACLGTATVLGFIGGGITGCALMSIAASCFPGDSLVMLKNGQHKSMSKLEIGDEVAIWGESGAIQFDGIYAFGHVDKNSNGLNFDIVLVPHLNSVNGTKHIDRKLNLRLSPGHFIPTLSAKGKVVHKRALDINVGDQLWAIKSFEENSTTLFTVKDISMTINKGLYNPFTLSGSIIVDGVVASTHSEWFLDNTFARVGIPDHWLPHAYQVVLFPIRLLYQILPLAQYRMLYRHIDSHLDIPTFGTKHGGLVASIWFGLPLISSIALIFQLFGQGQVKRVIALASSHHLKRKEPSLI